MTRMNVGTFLYAIFIVLMIFLTGVVTGWRLREYAGDFTSRVQVVEVRVVQVNPLTRLRGGE